LKKFIIALLLFPLFVLAALEPTPVRVLSPVPLPTGAATELTLQSILTAVDGVEGKLDTANGYLGSIDTDFDVALSTRASEATLSTRASEATLLNVLGAVDQLEGYVDGVETLVTSSNTKLDTLIAQTDTVESLIGTTNSTLTTIDGRVDQLEGYVDGLETLSTSTNTKLDTVNTNLTTIDGRVDQLEGYVDGVEGNQTSGAQKTQIVDGSGTVIGAAQAIAGVNYFPVTLAAIATNGAAVVTRSIQVAGSDGTNARTIATNALGQQIVNQSLHYNTAQQNTYDTSTNSVLVGTTETAFCLFRNPNASGKTVGITSIRLTGAGTFRLYHSPTITANGTALTPVNNYVKTGTQGNVGLPTFTPTISANGSLSKSITVSSQQGTYQLPLETLLILPANTSILITAQMGANNTPTNCGFTWWEL
jgi:hypothetical protein